MKLTLVPPARICKLKFDDVGFVPDFSDLGNAFTVLNQTIAV